MSETVKRFVLNVYSGYILTLGGTNSPIAVLSGSRMEFFEAGI